MKFSERTIERIITHVSQKGMTVNGDTTPQPHIERAIRKQTITALEALEPSDLPIEDGMIQKPDPPVPMILKCPDCNHRHVDKGKYATKIHHTHACQHCGFVWRPAIVATVGVQFLPGFKDPE